MHFSILTAAITLIAFAFEPGGAANRQVPTGFVTTNGQNFELDGKPFAFVGANSYVSTS